MEEGDDIAIEGYFLDYCSHRITLSDNLHVPSTWRQQQCLLEILYIQT